MLSPGRIPLRRRLPPRTIPPAPLARARRRALHASPAPRVPHPGGRLDEGISSGPGSSSPAAAAGSTASNPTPAELIAPHWNQPDAAVAKEAKYEFTVVPGESTSDASSSSSGSTSGSSSASPTASSSNSSSSLPVPFAFPPSSPHHLRHPSLKPPFNTHSFIRAVADGGGFPEGQSKGMMRIAEELIRRRRAWAEGETIGRGDLENQAYLFRAALSEQRAESASRSRADSASIRASLTALRREVDSLGQKLKEDIDTLKHEIQMEMNTRKNESRLETKVSEVAMEEVNHKSTITIGELRTEIEQAKWNNTRRGVSVIAFFVVFIIASVELLPAPKPALPAHGAGSGGGGQQPAVTMVVPDLRELERQEEGS